MLLTPRPFIIYFLWPTHHHIRQHISPKTYPTQSLFCSLECSYSDIHAVGRVPTFTLQGEKVFMGSAMFSLLEANWRYFLSRYVRIRYCAYWEKTVFMLFVRVLRLIQKWIVLLKNAEMSFQFFSLFLHIPDFIPADRAVFILSIIYPRLKKVCCRERNKHP